MVPATPTATANSPLCEGDVLQLTSSTVTNATYVWSGPNSFGATTQNESINGVTLAATGVYSVIAVVNGCNSLPATVNVLVSPQPAAPVISSNAPVCEGNPVNFTSNNIPGVSYSWTGPNTFISSVQNPSIPAAQITDAGIYTLVVSNGTCDATASTNVVVGPLPALPVVNSPLEVCVDEIVTLTAQGQNLMWYTQPTGGVGQTSITLPTSTATTMTYYVSQSPNGCEGGRAPLVVIVNPLPTPLTATGTNLTWYDVATGGTALPGAPTPNTAIPGVFNYYVTESDINCESHRTQITVTINAKPAAPPVQNKEYCRDDVATALTATGQNLLWYTVPAGGTGSATAPVPNTSTLGTTDYFVSQSVNGCEGDRSMIRVVVHEKVSAALTAEPDKACTGKPVTITFTGSAPDSANYTWTFGGADIQSGTGAGPYILEWNTSGDKTVTVMVTNHICQSIAAVVIDVDPTPVASFIMDDHSCVNGEVMVVADSGLSGLPGYTWFFSDADILSGTGAGPYVLSFSSPGMKLVSLQLTNINCPSEVAMDSINIHQPLAKINWDHGAAICSDDSVLFTAEPGLDYTYIWSPDMYFRKGNNSLSAWGIIATSSFVNLAVTDRWGCESYDSAFITTTPCCDVFLPNAFTPNDDGRNDGFRMVTKGKQQLSKFIIVDRWGQIMFETANQYEAWDGTFKGEAMPIGTYQYYLRYRCAEGNEMIEKKGDVTLLR
jgi:gliding motility-associated-like protein